MNQHTYSTTATNEPDTYLETADAVARAAHIWVRALYQDESRPEDERKALAGGLLAGLCDQLELSPRVREVVAFIYTLLDDEGEEALQISRNMMASESPKSRRAFSQGRNEAGAILEMLAYHERSN